METTEMHATATTGIKYEPLVTDELDYDKRCSATRNKTATLFAYISTTFAMGFSLGILISQKTTFLSKEWHGLPRKPTSCFLHCSCIHFRVFMKIELI